MVKDSLAVIGVLVVAILLQVAIIFAIASLIFLWEPVHAQVPMNPPQQQQNDAFRALRRDMLQECGRDTLIMTGSTNPTFTHYTQRRFPNGFCIVVSPAKVQDAFDGTLTYGFVVHPISDTSYKYSYIGGATIAADTLGFDWLVTEVIE